MPTFFKHRYRATDNFPFGNLPCCLGDVPTRFRDCRTIERRSTLEARYSIQMPEVTSHTPRARVPQAPSRYMKNLGPLAHHPPSSQPSASIISHPPRSRSSSLPPLPHCSPRFVFYLLVPTAFLNSTASPPSPELVPSRPRPSRSAIKYAGEGCGAGICLKGCEIRRRTMAIGGMG